MIEAMIAFSLFVLAVLLFYRWVERRHKILIGKFALVGAALLIVIAVFAWVSSRRRNEKLEALRRSVSVQFVRDTARMLLGSDTVRQVSFRLCNSGSDTVTYVSFWPKTLRRGRSTQYDLVPAFTEGGYRSNEFTSDYILVPGNCIVLTWQGEYVVLDTVIPGPVWVEGPPKD